MGAQENRGWEEYGRRERKGQEGEKWEEISSTAEYFTTKKARKRRKPKKRAGAGNARYRRWEVCTPPVPP